MVERSNSSVPAAECAIKILIVLRSAIRDRGGATQVIFITFVLFVLILDNISRENRCLIFLGDCVSIMECLYHRMDINNQNTRIILGINSVMWNT